MSDERLCTTCKFCCQEDYGYSNWTVEGTSLSCLRGLNPQLDGLEASAYTAAEKKTMEQVIRFADSCSEYVAGDGPTFDVDGETNIDHYKDDPDVYALLVARKL